MSNIIKSVRNKINDSNRLFIKNSLDVSDRIVELIEKHNISIYYIASELNKPDEEVKYFLSGFYNFTLKEISEIESLFGEKIINYEKS